MTLASDWERFCILAHALGSVKSLLDEQTSRMLTNRERPCGTVNTILATMCFRLYRDPAFRTRDDRRFYFLIFSSLSSHVGARGSVVD
jgi:hypothetical protein